MWVKVRGVVFSIVASRVYHRSPERCGPRGIAKSRFALGSKVQGNWGPSPSFSLGYLRLNAGFLPALILVTRRRDAGRQPYTSMEWVSPQSAWPLKHTGCAFGLISHRQIVLTQLERGTHAGEC